MFSSALLTTITKVVVISIFLSVTLVVGNAQASSLPPEIHDKADRYKKLLAKWANEPAIVEAVKDSNRRDGIPDMNNATWETLSDDDPIIMWLNLSTEGKQITQWEEDPAIVKLNLRDLHANLVASSYVSGKPLLYNNATRAPFQNGLKGPWVDSVIKPDPTTHSMAVQIAVPVLDGDKVIGVLHSALLAQ